MALQAYTCLIPTTKKKTQAWKYSRFRFVALGDCIFTARSYAYSAVFNHHACLTWRDQFALQRRQLFNHRYTEYWSSGSAIKESPDSKILWRRRNCLLRPNGDNQPTLGCGVCTVFWRQAVAVLGRGKGGSCPPPNLPLDPPKHSVRPHTPETCTGFTV